MCIIVYICMCACVYYIYSEGTRRAEGKGLFQKSHPRVSLFIRNSPAERASSTSSGSYNGGQQLAKMIDLTARIAYIVYMYVRDTRN